MNKRTVIRIKRRLIGFAKDLLLLVICTLLFGGGLIVMNTITARADTIAIEEIGETWTELGEYKITHYCPCKKCCGKSDGITASGEQAQRFRTVAMKGIPFGTKIYIESYGYRIVEDRGVGKGVVDVYVDDHQHALDLGVQHHKVWIVE